MPILTKRANVTDRRTDPNYKKASPLKILNTAFLLGTNIQFIDYIDALLITKLSKRTKYNSIMIRKFVFKRVKKITCLIVRTEL